MFKGLKARLNESIASNDASFSIEDSSTPNTSMVNNSNNSDGGGGLFGKFRQKITDVVTNSSMLAQDIDTPDSVMQVTEDEMMEIDKLVILTPGNQLPDLFRKQAVSRLKLRKKLKYVIGQYNGVVAAQNNLQEDTKTMREDLRKYKTEASLTTEYRKQLNERSELIFQLQSQVEILKETALVTEPGTAGSGAALIDISELSESIVSDTSELGHSMTYEQLYDRYQRYKLRYGKNRERLDKLSVTCQKLQKQNENLQKCLTVSQDRAIKKITQLKDTTTSIVDERRELVTSLQEKDDRIVTLREQLQNISAMGGFSDTESIMSEASEYNDVVTETLRRRNSKLKDKIRRLEEVLSKCKSTIQNGIDATNSLSKEKEELKERLEKLEFERDEQRACGEVTSSNEILVDISDNTGGHTPTNINSEELGHRITELTVQLDQSKRDQELRSQEIFQLVTEVERYKQDIIQLQAKVDSKSDNVSSVTNEVSAAKKRVLECENTIAQLNSDISVKENGYLSQLEEYKKETSSLQDKISKLSADNDGLKRELHDRDVNKAMELQDSKKEYAGQVTLLNNKVAALKQELDSSNRKLNVLKDRDSSLEDLLEEMSGIRGELERVSTENSELRQQISSKEEDLKQQSERGEKEIEQLQNKQREEKTVQNTELETQLRSLQEKYDSERSEKEELKEKEEQLQSDITRLTEHCKRLASELNVLNEERAKEKTNWENKLVKLEDSKISEREALEETHRSQLTPFKTKIKEMQAQITKLRDDKEEQDTEISDLTRHVFESNSDCAQLNDEVSNLQNKLQSCEKSTSLLHDQLKTKTTECVDLADSLSSATDNLKASQLTVTELQNQLDKITKDKTVTDKKLEELEVLSKDLDKLVVELRRKLKNSDEEHKMKSSQLQEAINSVMTDRDNIVRQHAVLQEQHSALEKSLDSKANGTEILSEQNRLLQERLNELQNDVNSLQQKLASAESQNKRLSQEEVKLRETLKEVEQQHNIVTEKLNSELSELKQGLDVLQNEKLEKDKKLSELASERDVIRKECEQNKKTFESEKNSLSELLEKVRGDLKKSEEDLKHSRGEGEVKGEQVRKLEVRLKELEGDKKESSDLLTRTRELKTDIEIKNKSISKLEADMINKAAEFNSKISSLQNDLESSHTTCELLRKQCSKSEAEMEEVRKKKEEEVKNLELRREEDLKMFAAQHQDEVKKQEELEAVSLKLKEEISELDRKLQSETANHQKAKEGLGRASQAIGKLRGYVKEQDNKIGNLTKLKDELETKHKGTVDSHNSSLSEVQESYMLKLEQSAETENRLKLELKSVGVERAELKQEKEELDNRAEKLRQELGQLKEILKEKIEENSRLSEEVESNKKESEGNRSTSEEKESRLGQLSNEVKQLQNQVEHFRGTENDIKSVLEQHRSVKGEVVDNDNKIVEVNLAHQIKDILLDLNKQLSQEQDEHKNTAEQRNQFKMKLVELKKKAEAKIIEITEAKKQLEQQVTQLKEEISGKECNSSELASKISDSDKERSDLLHKLELGEKSSNELREKLAELEKSHSENSAKLSDFESLLNEKELEKKALSQNLEQCLQSIQQKEVEITNLTSQLEEMEVKFSHEMEQKTVLQEQMNSQLHNLSATSSAERENLQKETETLQSERENFVSANSELKTKLDALQKEKCNQQDELVKLQTECSNLREAVTHFKTQSGSWQKEKETISRESETLHKKNVDLEQEINSLKEELNTARSYLEKQEGLQSSSLENEEKLRSDLESAYRDLKEKNNSISHLEKQVSSLKSDLSDHTSNQEHLTKLCNELKNRTKQLETVLSSREDEFGALQQENSRLSSHSNNLDVCFSSLKEEKNKIVESLSQMMSERDSLERAHKVQLLEMKTKLEKEHSQNVEQINIALQEKMQKVTQEEGQIVKLQTQVKKLESLLAGAKEEADKAQGKCSVQVSEYSSKLLLSEKKSHSLREQLCDLQESLESRDQEISKLKKDNLSELNNIRRDTIPRTEHDEIVFNLDMAYNMNLQETTDKLENRIQELETHLGGDHVPGNRSNPEETADLKKHLENLIRRHKIEIETIKNEAIFNANQEYEMRLKQWQESNEQRHLEDVNRVMEESSRERQRLLKEVEILKDRKTDRPTDRPLPGYNISAGRISISSDYSEGYMLESEYDYLKDVMYKYLKGEHTDQLLKVILAVLKFSEKEKSEILRGGST
ncbi:golgin subfamily A member 4-like isoform X2 [Bolinopsis microptera]|uniref:golgin subfamily A member 4-like isoform X2 n=1 Tax=Bolinopsis microptera TaxID=2820187 RepID=UPI00307A8013